MALCIPPHRELYLVAIAQGIWGRNNGKYRNLQPANAGKGIPDKCSLGITFRLIGKVPQGTAPAGTKGRTVGGDTAWTFLQQFLHLAEGIARQGLDDPNPEHITGGGGGNENSLSIKMTDAVAIAGKGLDGKGNDLIFLQRHSFLLK